MTGKTAKLFLGLTLAFILFTVFGTLSHEWGHYIMAVVCGHDAEIHYQYCVPIYNDSYSGIHGILFGMGGPLQTISTGSIGFFLVYLNRQKYYTATELHFGQWSFIFITLFWLREPFNLFTWSVGALIKGNFSRSGDEITLALHWDLPFWSIIVPLAITGAGILAFITFKIIPKKQRLTFLLAGLLGGFSGYFLWLIWLGPIIMP